MQVEDRQIITNVIPLFPELMADNVVDQIKASIAKINQLKEDLWQARQRVFELEAQLDQEQALFSLKSKLFQFEYGTRDINEIHNETNIKIVNENDARNQ